MNSESDAETSSNEYNTNETVGFIQVATVASGWMLDFFFVSLCRHFKEEKLEEFDDTLKAFEAVSQSSSFKATQKKKIMISAFLARVMHGKELDIIFEEDQTVMPLMSAAKIWLDLEETVRDESVFENITVLLLVQCVAVSIEKGKGSTAVAWIQRQGAFPQNLSVKLSAIVTQRNTYHPFLTTFSYRRLLEAVKSYLDSFLEQNPSDFLIKAATEFIKSKDSVSSEEVDQQENSEPEIIQKSTQKKKKTKRKNLFTKNTDVLECDPIRSPTVSLTRLSKRQLTSLQSTKSHEDTVEFKRRKPPRKWTPKLDKYLIEGVKRHGQGRWAVILMDFDFEGRTGTMLKDRWRILQKADKVD